MGRWTIVVRGPEAAARATVFALLGEDAPEAEELRAPLFGSWAGRAVEEAFAADPDAVARWRSDPTWAPPGGESLAAVCARVEAWLGDAADGERTLVVADAAVVRAAAVAALGADPSSCWRLDVAPLTVVRLQRHDGVWRLRALHPA